MSRTRVDARLGDMRKLLPLAVAFALLGSATVRAQPAEKPSQPRPAPTRAPRGRSVALSVARRHRRGDADRGRFTRAPLRPAPGFKRVGLDGGLVRRVAARAAARRAGDRRRHLPRRPRAARRPREPRRRRRDRRRLARPHAVRRLGDPDARRVALVDRRARRELPRPAGAAMPFSRYLQGDRARADGSRLAWQRIGGARGRRPSGVPQMARRRVHVRQHRLARATRPSRSRADDLRPGDFVVQPGGPGPRRAGARYGAGGRTGGSRSCSARGSCRRRASRSFVRLARRRWFVVEPRPTRARARRSGRRSRGRACAASPGT